MTSRKDMTPATTVQPALMNRPPLSETSVLRYGPRRRIVRELARYRWGRGRPQARVLLECGHTRAWYPGRAWARCRARACRQEALLARYDRLIHRMAWGCAGRLPAHSVYSQADLYQEGVLQAVSLLGGFDPARARFITYLYVSLQHRYGKILRKEWAAAAHARRRVKDDAGEEDAPVESPVTRVPIPPEQLAVELLVDLERGAYGPAEALAMTSVGGGA